MYKRIVKSGVILTLLMAMMAGAAQASVQVIGTAGYNSNTYNLIYDNASPFGSIVWLDYTHPADTWVNQKSWANGLLGSVTYYLNPGISINWGGSWRLPTTVDNDSSWSNPPLATSSEMAYLCYTDLGNTTGVGLANKGPFTAIGTNGTNGYYWSDTQYAAAPSFAWAFSTYNGQQNALDKSSAGLYAVAVRPGELVASTVPEPSTYALLCISLGVVGYARRKMGKQC